MIQVYLLWFPLPHPRHLSTSDKLSSRLSVPNQFNFFLVLSLTHLSSLDCEPCQIGNHHRATFAPRVNNHESNPFMLVYSDVCGPHHVLIVFSFWLYLCWWLFENYLALSSERSFWTLIYFLCLLCWNWKSI